MSKKYFVLFSIVIVSASYAMDKKNYDQVKLCARRIIAGIKNDITNGSFTTPQEVNAALQAAMNKYNNPARIGGYIAEQYRTYLNMPLRNRLDNKTWFFIEWADERPRKAYIETDNEKSVYIYELQNNKWTLRDTVSIDGNWHLTHVQPLGNMLALGVRDDNNAGNIVMQLYEKEQHEDAERYVKKNQFAVQGRIWDVALNDPKNLCAVLTSSFIKFYRKHQDRYVSNRFILIDSLKLKKIIWKNASTLSAWSDNGYQDITLANDTFSMTRLQPGALAQTQERSLFSLIAYTMLQTHRPRQGNVIAARKEIDKEKPQEEIDTTQQMIKQEDKDQDSLDLIRSYEPKHWNAFQAYSGYMADPVYILDEDDTITE